MIYFILGFISCFILFSIIAVIYYVIKIRKAKKTINKTVDGCVDINEFVDKLNQLKNIFTYDGDDGNV